MKESISAILLLSLLPGCSGILPGLPGGGAVVHLEDLETHAHGGSMSTLWYRGSDSKYHYFAHFFKVSTNYRIRRSELDWKQEFPLGSHEPVYASPEVLKLLKERARRDEASRTLPRHGTN